jgi:hypothetical protein
VIREMHIATNELVSDVDWTPESLAERIHDVLSDEPPAGRLRLPSLVAETR